MHCFHKEFPKRGGGPSLNIKDLPVNGACFISPASGPTYHSIPHSKFTPLCLRSPQCFVSQSCALRPNSNALCQWIVNPFDRIEGVVNSPKFFWSGRSKMICLLPVALPFLCQLNSRFRGFGRQICRLHLFHPLPVPSMAADILLYDKFYLWYVDFPAPGNFLTVDWQRHTVLDWIMTLE